MPGPLYTHLKDDLRINIKSEAEEMIQEASNPARTTKTFPPFDSSNFNFSKYQDLMSSLLLLRSLDIHTTNKSLVYFGNGAMSMNTRERIERESSSKGITETDAMFSITTMPCMCPIVLECCNNIKNDDINYAVVFQRDKEFLSNQNVNTMSELGRFTKETHTREDLEIKWRSMMAPNADKKSPPYPEEHLYNLASLTSEKMRIWDMESNDVVAQLMKMY